MLATEIIRDLKLKNKILIATIVLVLALCLVSKKENK